MQTLEMLCDILQRKLQTIETEISEWKQANEEEFFKRAMDEKHENKQIARDCSLQLEDIKNKRDMINKYYMAFYEDASVDVQLNMDVEPKMVDMSLYKRQLANPNRMEAANKIVSAAKSNLKFLDLFEKEVNEKLAGLEKKLEEKSSTIKAGYRMEEEQALFAARYDMIAASKSMISLADRSLRVKKEFELSDWEQYCYHSPERRYERILLGTVQRAMNFPEYSRDKMKDIAGWSEDKGFELPICLPMTGFHMMVEYRVKQAQETKEGIRTMIGNILRNIPAKKVRIYPVDLETMNAGAFGSLSLLGGPSPCFMAPVPENKDDVYEQLMDIYKEAVRESGLLVGYHDIEEYNETVSEEEQISQKFLIVYGCPEGLDHKCLELFQKIYYMSGQCGISIIAVHNSNSGISSGEANTFYQNMKEDALVIESDQDGQYIVFDQEKAPFTWQSGLTMLSKQTIEDIREAFKAEEVQEEEESPENCFEEINHVRGNKRLNLAFGINERKKVQKFAFEEMNFAAYVSGSAGCGKSSLLHTLITSILLNCHPEDVELWLIDFKMTEFQMYAKNMPPHVKRVILESSEEVVLDIIDDLTELMEHRAKIFGKYGIKNMIKLPAEFKYKHLPLVIVIVDEFATMTQIIRNAPIRGALTYAEKLENLMAKGRALGFRFIFSDQAYEKGIAGLTDKSKNQIGSRFAMANVSQEEMRGTLAVPSAFMTDQIRMWMASLPPYYALTSEQEDIPGTLEKKTVVHRNKVIFIPSDRINGIIDEVKRRYHAVKSAKEVTDDSYLDKNTLVVDGRRMYSYKEVEPEIAAWDKAQDYMEETMRLYLGRPCALRKQWPVELSQTPGENLLIVMEDYEMAASEVLSAMQSASSQKLHGLEGADITILAYRQDKLYNKYRQRWDKKNCLTDLAQICTVISDIRNKVEKNIAGNELIICMGMYSIYQEWSEMPKRKRTSGLFSGSSGSMVNMFRQQEIVMPSGDPSPLVSLLKEKNKLPELPKEQYSDLKEIPSGSISIDVDTSSDKEDIYTDEESMLYNAIEDFEYILTRGPAKGYHFIATLSKYSEYKELRWKEKMFRHLLYDNLAKDELADIAGLGRSARVPAGAVRYVSKQEAFSMRPYLWRNLIINGWTMDAEGNAVEAADDDDEFM